MVDVDASFPRETLEFLPVTVRDGSGATVDAGNVALLVLPQGTRPTSGWTAPYVLSGLYGVLLSGLTPGFYTVWARVTANPETPVIDLGSFRVS